MGSDQAIESTRLDSTRKRVRKDGCSNSQFNGLVVHVPPGDAQWTVPFDRNVRHGRSIRRGDGSIGNMEKKNENVEAQEHGPEAVPEPEVEAEDVAEDVAEQAWRGPRRQNQRPSRSKAISRAVSSSSNRSPTDDQHRPTTDQPPTNERGWTACASPFT